VSRSHAPARDRDLIQAFIHLIKLVALSEDNAARHWTKEARAFLFNAARRYRPSMRRDFDHEKLWSAACRLAADLKEDGHEPPLVPEGCLFDLEELVGGEADPGDLLARHAAVRHGAGRDRRRLIGLRRCPTGSPASSEPGELLLSPCVSRSRCRSVKAHGFVHAARQAVPTCSYMRPGLRRARGRGCRRSDGLGKAVRDPPPARRRRVTRRPDGSTARL
jgi:hypothetical protein